MGCKQVIFGVLKGAATSAADHALAVALGHVEGQTARAAVETLLARRTREGLKGLVGGWHRLDERLRELVLSRGDEVFGILREAFGSPVEQTRMNVIEVLRRGTLYRASYLLDSALHDRAPAVRSIAAQTVHALTEALLRSAPPREADLERSASLFAAPGHGQAPPSTAPLAHTTRPEAADVEGNCEAELGVEGDVQADLDEVRQRMAELEQYQEDRRQLAAAVDAALGSFELHQQVGVVEAAMWLSDDLGAKLWQMLLTPGSRLTKAAQGVLGRGRDPRLVPFMLAGLGYAEFRPIVAQVLASCTDPAFLEEWFRQSWRLAEPKAAKGLMAVRDLGCTRNQLLDVLCLTDDAQRHFARCVAVTGVAEPVKLEVLKEMHRRGGASGQRAALWALTGVQDARGTLLLRSIAAEGDKKRSWIARCELARRRPSEYPLSELLPSALAGRASKSAGSPSSAERMTAPGYWLGFERLSEAERLRLGKELLADGRLSAETVGGWLARPEAGDVIRALRVVGLLDLGGSLEEHLYRLCHDPRPEVRSAAVAALGKVATPTSRRLLHDKLYDPDPRVQANTVEALDRIGGASVTSELIPKLASADNRTRANAVRALLKLGVREAAETLLLMLRDENRAHRASALWLVDQMRLLPLAARVMNMAESDEDEQVRVRARILAGKIMDSEGEPAAAVAVDPAARASSPCPHGQDARATPAGDQLISVGSGKGGAS